jgi:site-specific recombinase XerC
LTLQDTVTGRAAALERIKALVLDTLPSPESKRAYGQALDDFSHWCGDEVVDGCTKATVNAYRAHLEARRLSSSTINQRLSAIRKLAMEAADNGFMPPAQASAISRVKGAKQAGVRTGQWLTREQAERLILVPDPTKPKGARDRAVRSPGDNGGGVSMIEGLTPNTNPVGRPRGPYHPGAGEGTERPGCFMARNRESAQDWDGDCDALVPVD